MDITITIDGVDYTEHTALPVKWNALLDERLDEGRLSVHYVKKDLFRIGAAVFINDMGFIIAEDEATEMPCGSGYYNHELSLIEPTKLLEGIVVESLTFTNNLGRTYNFEKVDVEPSVSPIPEEPFYVKGRVWLQGPVDVGDTITVPSTNGSDRIIESNGEPWPSVNAKREVEVIAPSGEVIYSANNTRDPENITINKIGQYRVIYTYGLQRFSTHSQAANYKIEYVFISLDADKHPLQKWDITSVINRVLNLAEPHLQSVSPRFKLDPTQAEEFAQILAPEFAFTKCTLKEILDQIGGFIHGIPRLIRGDSGEFDTIHYDMLGGTEQALLANHKFDGEYVTRIKTHNIESYATELDSTVDNLVNTLNSGEGAIVEPYANGFKSVRSEETYARIEEGNMVISTSLPIYSVQKLEVIDTQNKVGDITAYVFEGAEYGRLSSFDGNYPTSKAFAIYYTLGENNIKGLGYKSPTVIGGAGAKYAIANIIQAVTGDDISSSWWGKDGVGKYPQLAFRITYTPIFSARILQHKPYVEPNALKRTLVYNQGANLVETRYYGENMRGAIARMGNAEEIRTYKLSGKPTGTKLIPKVGQMWGDNQYVSAVTCAAYSDHVDCTIGLSEDFNRLSQYIGINSEWRAYEVSERKAYNRDMVYRDYCVIGDHIDGDGKTLARSGAQFYLCNTFSQSTITYGEYTKSLTVAKVITYDEQNNQYTVTLPVVSTAFGNTLSFSFGMADNYSAGPQSVRQDPSAEVTGYWQTDVPYVDYYGRVKDMSFYLDAEGEELGFNAPETFLLPQSFDNGKLGAPIEAYRTDRLVIDKNGTEILRMNYLIEFVSNRKDIIIGPAMARNCPMIAQLQSDVKHAAAVYVLNHAIGKFDSRINLSEATLVHDYTDERFRIHHGGIELGTVTSTVAGKAWTVADQSTGEILLAKNMDIADGTKIELPSLTLTHELP